MPSPIRVGAVMYDPKVSVIWEIIRRFFETEGVPIDVTFYSTYELQVSALLDDAIDIAWNSPLAWIDAQRRSGGHCRAIAMRDRPRPCQSSRGADDLITDGELRRDNFYSFVAERIDGVRLMTLAEMLDVVEDKVGFERMLETLDVPAYSISTPACVGRLRAREPLAQRDLAFLQTVTNRAVKVTVPGPYLLTRAMFVAEVTAELYPTKEDLAEDVVALLRDEVLALARQGADFIQLDEPVLSELAFAPARYADVHVRGSRGSKGSRRGAERCCISDQQSRRRHRWRAYRRPRLSRQLEPRRRDAARRRLSAARALSRAPVSCATRAGVGDRAGW